MGIRDLSPRVHAVVCASTLGMALGCSLQDFDPLGVPRGLGGTASDLPEAGVGGDGGSDSNAGSGGSGSNAGDGGNAGNAGAAGDGGTGGDGGSGGSPNTGELMDDPGFESGFSNWSAFGTATLTRVQTQAHGGMHSLLCTGRAAFYSGPGILMGGLVSSAPDAPYTVSVWVRAAESDVPDGGPPPRQATIELTLKTKCPGQTDTDANYDILGSALLTDAWTLITGTTPPRWCPAPIEHRLYLAEPYETPAPYVDFYMDDVSFMLAE